MVEPGGRHAMSIEVRCQACGARFAAPERSAGKSGKCPKCRGPITVPPLPASAGSVEDRRQSGVEGGLNDLLGVDLAAGPAISDPRADISGAGGLAGGPALGTLPKRKPQKSRGAVWLLNAIGSYRITSKTVFVLAPVVALIVAGIFVLQSDRPVGLTGFILFAGGVVTLKAFWIRLLPDTYRNEGMLISFVVGAVGLGIVMYAQEVLREHERGKPKQVADAATNSADKATAEGGGAREPAAQPADRPPGTPEPRASQPTTTVVAPIPLNPPGTPSVEPDLPEEPAPGEIELPPTSESVPPERVAQVPRASGSDATATPSVGGEGSSALAGRGPSTPWPIEADPAPQPAAPYRTDPIPLGLGNSPSAVFGAPAAGRVVVKWRMRREEGEPLRMDVGSLESYDLFTGEQIAKMTVPCEGSILAVSPSGERVLIRYDSRRVALYSLAEGRALHEWDPCQGNLAVHEAAFIDEDDVDEDDVVICTHKPQQMTLWKFPGAKRFYSLEVQSPPCLSPGRRFLVAVRDGTPRVFDSRSGKEIGRLEAPVDVDGNPNEVFRMVFSADGRRLAATVHGQDRGIWVWDFNTGRLTDEIPGRTAGQSFIPQWIGPRHLILSGRGGLVLVDLDRGGIVWSFEHPGGSRLRGARGSRAWFLVYSTSKEPTYLVSRELLDEELSRRIAEHGGDVARTIFGPGTAVTLDTSAVGHPDLPEDFAARMRDLFEEKLTSAGMSTAPDQATRVVARCRLEAGETMTFEEKATWVLDKDETVSIHVPALTVEVEITHRTSGTLWQRKSTHKPVSVKWEFKIPRGEDPKTHIRRHYLANQARAAEDFFSGLVFPRKVVEELETPGGKCGFGSTVLNLRERLEPRILPGDGQPGPGTRSRIVGGSPGGRPRPPAWTAPSDGPGPLRANRWPERETVGRSSALARPRTHGNTSARRSST